MGVPIPPLQRHLAEVEERLRALEARIHALEDLRDDPGGAPADRADFAYAVEDLRKA